MEFGKPASDDRCYHLIQFRSRLAKLGPKVHQLDAQCRRWLEAALLPDAFTVEQLQPMLLSSESVKYVRLGIAGFIDFL